jgi:hypothetical protein
VFVTEITASTSAIQAVKPLLPGGGRFLMQLGEELSEQSFVLLAQIFDP